MATRTEDRFGEVTSLGTTYVSLGGPVPSSTTWNVLINVCNRTAAVSNLRLYIADATWTAGDGEPLTTKLKAAICVDLPIAAGATVQISGIIVKTTEELVARASVAASLDIMACGMAIT